MDHQSIALGVRAGLPCDLIQRGFGELEPIQIADCAAGAAYEVRVRIGAEVEMLKPVKHADGIDRALGFEHRKVAVDRRQRQVGDLRLQLGVDPFRGRMARRAAQTFQDRVALAAVLSDSGHLKTSFFRTQ